MSQTTSPRPTIRLADITLPEHDEASSAPVVNRVDRVDRVVVEAPLTIVVGGNERMATHLGTFWTPVMRDRLGSLAIEHPDMVSDDVRDALERANEGVRR